MCCTQQTNVQPLLEAEYSAESSWTDFFSDSEYKLEMDSPLPLTSSANMMLVFFHTVLRTMFLVHNVVVDTVDSIINATAELYQSQN
jgi:hypothetical protein